MRTIKKLDKVLSKAGFTLVELLVVLALLGILIGVAIAGVGIAQRGTRDDTRIRDLTSLKGLLEDYYGSVKTYPAAVHAGTCNGSTVLFVSAATVDCAQTGSYIKVQQPGLDTTIKSTASCDTYSSTNNSWVISYTQNSSGASYTLCARLENGTSYNLNN
ncbi:MAG: prepilin-type N-terminal cleavage/methylation domain-containing protein [bacterium]